MEHNTHNDEYIDEQEYQQLTKEGWNTLAIGVSILIFLFFISIGLIVSWQALESTVGMFTFFWAYQGAMWLSKGIVFTNITARGVGKALLYILCIFIICFSMIYEILVLFGQ